jgi:hypothetical protein
MTATKTVANNTENTETIKDAPVVDAQVVSSDTTPEPEAPAEGEDNNTTKPEAPADGKDSAAVSKDQQTLLDDAKRVEERNSKGREYSRALESTGHYQDLGCFYAASTPVPAAFGAEIGVVTKDEKTMKVQRTGIGFYIRSDHMANTEIDYSNI